MNIRIDQRITTAGTLGALVLLSGACNGELAVVDDLDSNGANLTTYRTSGPPMNAACACASSDSLMALSCGGGAVPLLDNDVVQTTADGNIVAFNLCEGDGVDAFGDCHVVYWDGGFAELPIASGFLLALSASGAHVLTAGDPANPVVQLIGLNGTSTIPLDVVLGHGALSASGDTVVGTIYPDNAASQLARVNTSSGEVEVLGTLDGFISRAYITPDASAIVGHSSNRSPDTYQAFRWTEQGMTLGLSGVPGGIATWPEAVSTDGSVIAGRSLPEKMHFRWTEADGYVELARASWYSETLLSADGSVVLGSLDPAGANETSAFRWTEATGAIEIAPGVATLALDMSDDGSVVVALSWEEAQLDGASPEQTFVWNATNGTRTLEAVLQARGADTTGWEFGHARALSGNGKVLLGRATCGGVPTLYRVVLSD